MKLSITYKDTHIPTRIHYFSVLALGSVMVLSKRCDLIQDICEAFGSELRIFRVRHLCRADGIYHLVVSFTPENLIERLSTRNK